MVLRERKKGRWNMIDKTEDLIKALNDLKVEVQRIREVVDLLLDLVIEGEIDENLMLELKMDNLRDLDPFSINN